MIVEILKENVSGKIFWTPVSEKISLEEAQKRVEEYYKQYPKNKYRISKSV